MMDLEGLKGFMMSPIPGIGGLNQELGREGEGKNTTKFKIYSWFFAFLSAKV